ncbi:MAG: DsbA family protein [Mesorhizobium sp.]|uniref:DsbA family protein n=1 Tax=Mesorhizobium sp. TaxID=1871066 RepID=UPI000FE9302A|nr:DsbA family protein [Mesorhizobium sp.]RWN02147.1 MAG: DsbA family protein [Mesorhizobium sp.]
MPRLLSRRNLLSSLAAIPAVALLAACSDSGEKAAAEDVKPAAPADAMKPADPAKPAAAAAAKAPEAEGTVDMAALLKPGALPDMQLGKDDAKVTIVEYASMTCPHCAHFHATTLPALKTKYIDTGKARLILREFPFDPSAEAGFMLARCSKDNYFPMVDVLFKQQANWAGVANTKDALLQISKMAGFTQESFEACLTDQKLLDDVRSVQKRGADEFKVDSTPTFFINGKTYKGALSIEEISAIIDPLL